MIPTSYSTFPAVPAVKTYCDTVQQDGGIEGPDGKISPVEGFVVRGHKKGGSPGEAFFWKVKYDEPYLMYREWRELTRKLLKDLDGVNLNKIKSEESRLYVWWVRREIENDREKFAPWEHGKGIIKTREEFLKWAKTKEAKTAKRELGIQVEMDEEERRSRKFSKTLLVPVAIQGCGSSLPPSPPSYSSYDILELTTFFCAGKTALGLELSHLFGWGHVQSDDFLQKKPAPHFLKAIKELLKTQDVVFADKSALFPSSPLDLLLTSDLTQEQPHRQAPHRPYHPRRLPRSRHQRPSRRPRLAHQHRFPTSRQVSRPLLLPHRRPRR